jgi:dynactin complex subunit
VQLFEPNGKNNGTVGGHVYFEAAEKHGSLCDPGKVTIIEVDPVWEAAVGSRVTVLNIGNGVLRYYGPHKVRFTIKRRPFSHRMAE